MKAIGKGAAGSRRGGRHRVVKAVDNCFAEGVIVTGSHKEAGFTLFNGIAYPADGIVAYAQAQGLEPEFINACCGVSW